MYLLKKEALLVFFFFSLCHLVPFFFFFFFFFHKPMPYEFVISYSIFLFWKKRFFFFFLLLLFIKKSQFCQKIMFKKTLINSTGFCCCCCCCCLYQDQQDALLCFLSKCAVFSKMDINCQIFVDIYPLLRLDFFFHMEKKKSISTPTPLNGRVLSVESSSNWSLFWRHWRKMIVYRSGSSRFAHS